MRMPMPVSQRCRLSSKTAAEFASNAISPATKCGVYDSPNHQHASHSLPYQSSCGQNEEAHIGFDVRLVRVLLSKASLSFGDSRVFLSHDSVVQDRLQLPDEFLSSMNPSGLTPTASSSILEVLPCWSGTRTLARGCATEEHGFFDILFMFLECFD